MSADRWSAARWISALALLTLAPRLSAQTRLWREDERVTVTSFNEVAALAFDGRRVFAATLNGLEIYDAAFRRWLPPATSEQGYPVFPRPVAAVWDRSQGGLWIATAGGPLYFRSDLSGRWDIRPFGPSDSVVALALRRSRAAESDVALRVMRGTMGIDPFGRRWPITAMIPAERPGTYWVGTAGGNILLADSRSLSAEWLAFGTLARGTGALAIDQDGKVWFGGDGLGPRDGLARADSALQKWEWFESYAARAPRQVNRILAGETTWVAAADGLYALLPDARYWKRFGQKDGLPSDNVRALARTARHIWAGTAQGVVVIDAQSMTSIGAQLPGIRINGLAARNDTVWIASNAGLLIGAADSTSVQVALAPGADANPILRGPVAGVARAGDGIAALTEAGVYVFDTHWSEGPLRDAALLATGRTYDVRGDAGALFVLGSRGIAEWNLARNMWSYLAVPGDIAEGPVRDVVRTGPFLWVATPVGASRLRWP